GGQALEDFVGDAVGGGAGQFQGRGVGDAGAVRVGGRLPGGLGELADLPAGPVDEDDADAQAAEDGDVAQQVAEVVVGDDGPVERDHEHLVAEVRHVVQDFAQVGQTKHCPLPLVPCHLSPAVLSASIQCPYSIAVEIGDP